MTALYVIAGVVVVGGVLFVLKKKSGCCAHKPEGDQASGEQKKGCCGGH
jgi:hypothetical protein